MIYIYICILYIIYIEITQRQKGNRSDNDLHHGTPILTSGNCRETWADRRSLPAKFSHICHHFSKDTLKSLKMFIDVHRFPTSSPVSKSSPVPRVPSPHFQRGAASPGESYLDTSSARIPGMPRVPGALRKDRVITTKSPDLWRLSVQRKNINR